MWRRCASPKTMKCVHALASRSIRSAVQHSHSANGKAYSHSEFEGQKIDARGTIIWNPTSTLEEGRLACMKKVTGHFSWSAKLKRDATPNPTLSVGCPTLTTRPLSADAQSKLWHGRKAKSLTPTKLKRCSAK